MYKLQHPFNKALVMSQTSRVHSIRQLIRETFFKLGSTSTAPPREMLLIRDGNYCGHRFQCDELQAVWFFEENQLKFYGADGTVVKVVTPFVTQDDQTQRAA